MAGPYESLLARAGGRRELARAEPGRPGRDARLHDVVRRQARPIRGPDGLHQAGVLHDRPPHDALGPVGRHGLQFEVILRRGA